ncbi:MAG: 50S ribosomal protein L25 [Candidatus Wildermuthbacteria bacterium]|nr:50S ribosomal protein L25 [Candidatus Wildermuthbacteria bacterium]
MTILSAQPRNVKQKPDSLRKEERIPAVLYGPKRTPASCSVQRKEFELALKEAGESTLVTLHLADETPSVFIYDIQRNPLTGTPIHIDFYEPSLTELTEIDVPLVFTGEAGAVKDFGGTLMKHIQEIEVKGLPQDLPHEIRVDITRLASFEDKILVKDLVKTGAFTFTKDEDEVVAQVIPAENVEEELSKPVEGNIEDVQKVEKEKKASDDETTQE